MKHTGKDAIWKGQLDLDSIFAITLVSGYKFFPQDGVIKDVLNSNKINYIQNMELRHLITSLPHEIELIKDEDGMYRFDLHNYFLPYIGKIYPTKNMNSYINVRGLNYDLGPSRIEFDPESLLRDLEFESLVNTQQIWIRISIAQYKGLENKYQKILDLIDYELEN